MNWDYVAGFLFGCGAGATIINLLARRYQEAAEARVAAQDEYIKWLERELVKMAGQFAEGEMEKRKLVQ